MGVLLAQFGRAEVDATHALSAPPERPCRSALLCFVRMPVRASSAVASSAAQAGSVTVLSLVGVA